MRFLNGLLLLTMAQPSPLRLRLVQATSLVRGSRRAGTGTANESRQRWVTRQAPNRPGQPAPPP
jgi:hypothetical protein